jgi:hypothetical protein
VDFAAASTWSAGKRTVEVSLGVGSASSLRVVAAGGGGVAWNGSPQFMQNLAAAGFSNLQVGQITVSMCPPSSDGMKGEERNKAWVDYIFKLD